MFSQFATSKRGEQDFDCERSCVSFHKFTGLITTAKAELFLEPRKAAAFDDWLCLWIFKRWRTEVRRSTKHDISTVV